MRDDLFGHRSTLDTGDRAAFDFYPTPGWMTRSLVYHVPEIAGSVVLECASGDNAIADVLRDEFGCTVRTNDLDRSQPSEAHFDATAPQLWQAPPVDYVITNPPFDQAFWMLQHAVEHASVGVAFLLRKTFLEPTDIRGQWLSNHPPSRMIGLPRHKFRAGSASSDSVSTDWLIWERHPRRDVYPIEIDHLAKSRTKGSV